MNLQSGYTKLGAVGLALTMLLAGSVFGDTSKRATPAAPPAAKPAKPTAKGAVKSGAVRTSANASETTPPLEVTPTPDCVP